MSVRRHEPVWLTRTVVGAIHEAQLREHGGALGVRDEGLLASALARPQNKFAYTPDSHLAVLAAAYAFGIAKNHLFVDGNKRTAFVSAALFLRLNGFALVRDEPDVALTIARLAAGEVSEPKLAAWFREGMQAIG